MKAKLAVLALGVGLSATRRRSQPPTQATMRRHVSVLSAAAGLVAMLAGVVAGASKTLDIYFIDNGARKRGGAAAPPRHTRCAKARIRHVEEARRVYRALK